MAKDQLARRPKVEEGNSYTGVCNLVPLGYILIHLLDEYFCTLVQSGYDRRGNRA